MKIEVKRTWFDAKLGTLGQMYVDDLFVGYTLEDPVRPFGVKIHGQTAIPVGLYKIEIRHSAKFQRDMPFLVGVSNFVGVMIHWGNTTADTEGCILVGDVPDTDQFQVLSSRPCFAKLWEQIEAAHKRGEEITIEISGAP